MVERYVLECRCGKEKEVIKIIKGIVDGYGMLDLVSEIFEDSLISGYIYIDMVFNSNLINIIEKISCVKTFIRFGNVIVSM